MKFEEKNCVRVEKIDNVFVYFLIKGEEVVYVGQTRVGMQRPLSHTDKDFDYIMVQYCDISKLDEIESKYIVKYNPIYNKTMNTMMWYGMERARNIIRRKLNNHNFTVPKLRKVMKEINVTSLRAYNTEVLYIDDLYKIINYLKGEQNGHN